MKDERKTEIRVGITVIVGVVLFIWVLSWAKNYSLTSSREVVNVKFDNVSGLEVGDNVTVNGVKKGYVEDMEVKGDNVIVKLTIDSDVKLKKDATFAVSMLDLMGGKKVEVTPGISSQPIDLTKVQHGIFEADIPKVMSIIGQVEGDLPGIISDLKVSLSSLNTYLTDHQLNRNIKLSVKNLAIISEKLNRLLDENSKNFNSLAKNSNELITQMNEFLTNNRTDIEKTLSNIKDLTSRTDTLIAQINGFAKDTKQQKNNIGKLMYNEDLYKKLNLTMDQINQLTKTLLHQVQGKGINIDAHIF